MAGCRSRKGKRVVMTKGMDDSLIVGLDIGTSTVSALVGEILPDGQINIIGSGSSPSRGMDKGGVNDLDSVIKSVERAVNQAELMAECKISNVFLSISGQHITSALKRVWEPSLMRRFLKRIWNALSIPLAQSR